MSIDKARYWWCVLYPENMLPDWQDRIADSLQIPFCYCIHDSDLLSDGDESRKIHLHLMLCFSNTTTKKHADQVFHLLDSPGHNAVAGAGCQAIQSVRHAYDYLIHNTEDCKKAGKFLYDPARRICGNNFDIGCYEQLSLEDKQLMVLEIAKYCIAQGFTNFTDFQMGVWSDFDSAYHILIPSYSNYFDKLVRGNYNKFCPKKDL